VNDPAVGSGIRRLEEPEYVRRVVADDPGREYSVIVNIRNIVVDDLAGGKE
jgi:hypothetical protein